MSFTKLTTALDLLNNLDSASEELRNGIRHLKSDTVSPAQFIMKHFPSVGTKSHAVYAVARVLITRDGTTSGSVVIKHVKRLLLLQHIEAKKTNAEAHEVTLSDHEIKGHINTLVTLGKLIRTPGGTLT